MAELSPASQKLVDAGDLMAAMRAQDRDAVRVLMSQRTSGEEAACGEGLEDVICPICKELLHKPIVNKCGHAACFWCTHKAMDPLSPSACPLCRAPFEHFNAVCEPLHAYIIRNFPAEHARREAQVAEMERGEEGISGGRAPEVVAPEAGDDTAFACRRCGAAPAAYATCCGHVVCGACAGEDCACGARTVFKPTQAFGRAQRECKHDDNAANGRRSAR